MTGQKANSLIDEISQILERKESIQDLDATFHALVKQRPNGEQTLRTITDIRTSFNVKAKELGAKLTEVPERALLQSAIKNSLAEGDSVNISPQSTLTDLPPDWPTTTSSNSVVNIAQAEAGIAETGTLCFISSSVPSSTLFLCEKLFAVIHVNDLYDRQEHLWKTLKERNNVSCRAVHLVTGPSRTADVEQTVQVGAHGPKELHIFLVG